MVLRQWSLPTWNVKSIDGVNPVSTEIDHPVINNAEYLKRLRLRAKITPAEMAEIVGVSKRQIYYIEDGTASLSIEAAQKWLHATEPNLKSFLSILFPQFLGELSAWKR